MKDLVSFKAPRHVMAAINELRNKVEALEEASSKKAVQPLVEAITENPKKGKKVSK